MSSDIAGYRAQPAEAIAAVNAFKADEERLLRAIDTLRLGKGVSVEQRWLSIAQTHLQQGFMALNRAILQPERIALPEDVSSAERS